MNRSRSFQSGRILESGFVAFLLFITIALFSLGSCGSSTDAGAKSGDSQLSLETAQDSLNLARAEYESLKEQRENAAMPDGNFIRVSKTLGEKLQKTTLQFAEELSLDEQVEYMMEAGGIYEEVFAAKEAQSCFDWIWEQHPDHASADLACYRAAHLSEIYQYDDAFARLEAFVKDFPDSEYAEQADLQLQFLGDPDALFEAIQNQSEE
jgi:tetratricopeptide (TPR) repeat protein